MTDTTTKPVVHYDTGRDYVIKVGNRAFVYPVDHTDSQNVSNTTYAMTSRVVKYDEVTGVFETENTMYRPLRIK